MFVVLPALVVLAGCLIAALPHRAPALLPPLRTAAVVSALVVVFFGLLPESIDALGPAALVVAALGFALPVAMERLRGVEAGGRWALAALAAHQVVDGAQVAWLGPEIGLAGALGVSLHGAALSAAAVIAAGQDPARARRAALILVAATLLGGMVGAAVAASPVAAAEAWLRAVISGLLLHALLHDVGYALPRSQPERAADLAVAALAIGVGALALGEHDHAGHGHGQPPSEALIDTFGHLAVQASPWLLVGLAGAVVWAARRGDAVTSAVDDVIRRVFPWVLAGLVGLALVRLSAPAADAVVELAVAGGVVMAAFSTSPSTG